MSPFTAVTGTQLLFPKIAIDKQNPESPYHYVRQLARHMTQIDFTALSEGHHHAERSPYLPPELDTCTHVWVRVDRVKRPLSAPYIGPMAVVQRNPKWFRVKLPTGRTDVVSIERLKPAVFPAAAEGAAAADDEPPPDTTEQPPPDDTADRPPPDDPEDRPASPDPVPQPSRVLNAPPCAPRPRVQFAPAPHVFYYNM